MTPLVNCGLIHDTKSDVDELTTTLMSLGASGTVIKHFHVTKVLKNTFAYYRLLPYDNILELTKFRHPFECMQESECCNS
jgi:hypothetical protein